MELKITFTLSDRVVFLHEVCLPLGSKWLAEWTNNQDRDAYYKQMALGRYIVSAILDEKSEYCTTIPIYDWNLIRESIYKYMDVIDIKVIN